MTWEATGCSDPVRPHGGAPEQGSTRPGGAVRWAVGGVGSMQHRKGSLSHKKLPPYHF